MVCKIATTLWPVVDRHLPADAVFGPRAAGQVLSVSRLQIPSDLLGLWFCGDWTLWVIQGWLDDSQANFEVQPLVTRRGG